MAMLNYHKVWEMLNQIVSFHHRPRFLTFPWNQVLDPCLSGLSDTVKLQIWRVGVSWMDLDSPEAQRLLRNYSLYQPRRMWPHCAFLTCGDVAEISIFGPRNGHVMPFHTAGPNVCFPIALDFRAIAWGRIELPRWRAKPRTSICPFLVNWPLEDLVDNVDIQFIKRLVSNRSLLFLQDHIVDRQWLTTG